MNFGEKNNNGLYIFIYVERDGELIMSKTKVVVTHVHAKKEKVVRQLIIFLLKIILCFYNGIKFVLFL